MGEMLLVVGRMEVRVRVEARRGAVEMALLIVAGMDGVR